MDCSFASSALAAAGSPPTVVAIVAFWLWSNYIQHAVILYTFSSADSLVMRRHPAYYFSGESVSAEAALFVCQCQIPGRVLCARAWPIRQARLGSIALSKGARGSRFGAAPFRRNSTSAAAFPFSPVRNLKSA